MFCSKQTGVSALAAALFILIPLVSSAAQEVNQTQTNTTVNLRWGPRPGVARYRLQLAQDRDFADIVFDRVITGNQTQVNDLAPGRYFWRVAPLTAKLGEFSSAGVVDIVARAAEPLRNPTPVPTPAAISSSSPPRNPPANSIVATGGWRAAIGDASLPVLAHLRSPDRWYVVTTSSDGVTYALDASNGVALWSVRSAPQTSGATSSVPGSPIIVPASRLDDVVVISSSSLVRVEGSTGRELWRATLPAFISSATVVGQRNSTNLIVTDTSLQRLFFLNSSDGKIISQIKLPGRIVGKPTALDDFAHGAFALAYENGQIEIRDSNGALIRSGSAASQATTPAIQVRGRRGNLVLVGTRDGLTALTADTLQPLGRVALDSDRSRGNLTAEDLDGDGIVEVLMTTVRGHVVVVNTGDGKIVWDVAARNDTGTFAFADLNRDGVIDVFTSDGPGLVALSGRDGSVIWRDTGASSAVANHTTSFSSRALTALPSGSGTVIIVNEPARGGLRAVTFPNVSVRPSSH
ncbi:MAG TPA: PQQ-binding-like beta-propeller repeat protein [Pyrinomonadaceae bacterium]|nr:PQQ-binding-like beta-propeller repeat protein [Pyrinomonadaceae bacterium]